MKLKKRSFYGRDDLFIVCKSIKIEILSSASQGWTNITNLSKFQKHVCLSVGREEVRSKNKKQTKAPGFNLSLVFKSQDLRQTLSSVWGLTNETVKKLVTTAWESVAAASEQLSLKQTFTKFSQ